MLRQEKTSKGMKNKGNKHKTNKMEDLSPNIATITLNINGLNIPIKRQIGKVDNKKIQPNYMLYKTLISNLSIGRLKVNGWEKIHPANIIF